MSAGGRPAQPEAEGWRRLLAFLDADPRRAEGAYQRLRARLVQLFVWRGVPLPQDLADETLSRVARRLGEGVEIESGDPFRFCCGVAFRVQHEALRRAARQHEIAAADGWPTVTQPAAAEEEGADLACLQGCLAQLKPKGRTLILRYYEGEHGGRIARRKLLAQELGIPPGALRNRAQRLRSKLEGCVAGCLRERDVPAARHTPGQRRELS